VAGKGARQKKGTPIYQSKGYGSSKPVADNGSELGRAQNRRVELVRQ